MISKNLTLSFIALSFFFISCGEEDIAEKARENWAKAGSPEMLEISYPLPGTVFPPEITAPTVLWKDNSDKADFWAITVESDAEIICSDTCSYPNWKPEKDTWKEMKEKSLGKDIRIRIFGLVEANESRTPVSGGEVTISTSSDSVGAPIFYRDVPLPFKFAVKAPHYIKWRIKDISCDSMAPVILENLPVCGNCHSFTLDGKTLAMDVDYANDKGSYVITDINDTTRLNPEKVITWSDFRRDDGEVTFGLLSQISPKGRYVVSTVKDVSIFEPIDNLYYSQLFFPFKGILAYYDRYNKEFRGVPGADDKDYVQSNPAWSPDGNHILFARNKAIPPEESGLYKSALLSEGIADTTVAKRLLHSFTEGGRQFKFDLYRVPFNNGRGGVAEPVPGASENGKSNYFGKYSPDGKWLVFCRAESFMLLQPDSKLYIMPAEGGEPRLMNCNTENMNSWHSWSPNSRWLVFSSKLRGPYTKLYLTHIDENGNDSPPVYIENLVPEKRAVNIPEFVNIPINRHFEIVPEFLGSENYNLAQGMEFLSMGNFEGAASELERALEVDPDDKWLPFYLGNARMGTGDYKGAIESYTTYIKRNEDRNQNDTAYFNRGEAKRRLGLIKDAITDFKKSIGINPKYEEAFNNLGYIFLESGEYRKAIDYFDKLLKLSPNHAYALNNRGWAKFKSGNIQGAFRDINKSIDLDPTNSYAFRNRALVRIERKQFNQACSDLNEALNLGFSRQFGPEVELLIKKHCK